MVVSLGQLISATSLHQVKCTSREEPKQQQREIGMDNQNITRMLRDNAYIIYIAKTITEKDPYQ